MAYTDIYYIDDNNIGRNHYSSFILDQNNMYNSSMGSILTHQSQPQQDYTTTSYEKKDLLYTSNQFINNYQYLPDETFSIATTSDLHHLQQPSNQLTPLLTPSPQLSELHSVYSNNYLPSYSSDEGHLFAPIENRKPKTTRKRKTSPATEKNHICPICDHRSKRKHNLIEHMLTHNPHRPKTFLCSHCSRPFARKYDMKRHEKIHTR